MANATDEDVRLFALFSTAAKCFLCRAWREADDVRARAPDDALVSRVVRRVWLPLLADDIRSDTADRTDRTDRSIDDGHLRRQVIDECVAALRWLNGAGDVAARAMTKTLARVFLSGETPSSGTVGGSDGDADEPEFGAMRFEDAVELAAALFQCAANSPANGAAEEGTLARALGTRDESQKTRTGFGFFSATDISVEASKTLVYIARLDVEGMDATRWRRVLACLAPAAIDVCERHGAETPNTRRVLAREDFADDVFSRVRRMMNAGAEMDGSGSNKDERASGAFEAYFFDMLRLNATRELLLGPPGFVRDAFGTHPVPDPEAAGVGWASDEKTKRREILVRVLARGVASDERAFRRAALAAIRHGLGVSEETGVWTFDESPWCEFTALVDALEDFAAHLVDAAWKHIDALHPPAAANLTDGRSGRVPYQLVISAWTRGLRHANPTVRGKTLETFRAREWGALRPDANLMRSLDLPDGERFATDALIRAATETPNGDEKVKDFLRVYIRGDDSRDTSGAMRRVMAVVVQVSRCAATANTQGVDVGTSIVEHAARAYESAFGDAWYYTCDTEIRYVLDTLGDCAVALLSVSRGVDPATLANRARVVFDAARILAPFSCTAALLMTKTAKDIKRIFNSVLRLLRVAPSETIDGDGPASMGARAAAAAWLKTGSDNEARCFTWFCGVLITTYVLGDPSLTWMLDTQQLPPADAMRRLATGEFRGEYIARDDDRKTEESQSFTEALVADADALARAWSFCRDDGSATIAQCVSNYLTVSFDQSQDGLRSMRSPQKRRALLLLRAVFRLAGVLERASAKDGGDKLGCSRFLDMARDSFDFYVMKTPIMRDVVLAAADLVFGNGIERTDFTDERYDRFAGAAVGWSEAVFRWAPSSGKTSTEWAELMSLGTQVMSSLSIHVTETGSGISARRRGDLALALASAARGVASLSSSTATRRRFAVGLGEKLEPENHEILYGAVAQAMICLVRIEQSLVALEKDTNASPEDEAFATSAAWTATTAVLSVESPSNLIENLNFVNTKAPFDIGYDVPRALVRRAVAFLPAAARLGADATVTTFRVVADLVTLVAANPREPSHEPRLALATTSSSIFEASHDLLFRSTKFRKNAPVWAAAASAALHPAFFDADPADLDISMHAGCGETEGACVRFVRGAVAISRKSGGARVARAVARALAERLIRTPERAEAYARDIFELGLAGEGEQTRGISRDALTLAHRERGDTRDAIRDTDVAARVAALVLAHALASGAPPERFGADEAAAYSAASRRGALAILRVALDAVSGADKELARETYRRGSPTHRRKVRAWQMLCACAPALEKSLGVSREAAAGDAAGDAAADFAERKRLALISKLIASAPACLSRRELPGVRYYAETFHCLAVTHAPALVERCALPALADPETKPFVAASWIVVAASFVLRRRRVGEMLTDALLTDARRVFASVFPWSMAHNHTLRVFAQAATRDLLEAFSPSAFAPSFGARVRGATRDETETETETETENGVAGVGEDALETTLRVLTTNEEMRKTRDACGDLFTQNLDASPRALLRGALDIEPRDRASETTGTETETETETDGVAFEGAPVSAIDRVDAFLQSARVEIRSEREHAEAVLWRDAMRGGHDAREKVTGVVGDDDAASYDDDAESKKNSKVSASDFLQKKFFAEVGGEPQPRSQSNAPSDGRFAFDGDDTHEKDTHEKEKLRETAASSAASSAAARDGSPGLVVVASLVEKIPNLAGLARTCEVLGAERLVLADLGVAKHKDFTSVSVTAEKWLRLDECPILGLAAYLARLKREGYFLVGLEQTRGAEDVEAHAWHRKTALVLGREREGVDADILGMLDACVVIRQRGMIRSLNVHVSASMAVSRYAAKAHREGW